VHACTLACTADEANHIGTAEPLHLPWSKYRAMRDTKRDIGQG